MYNYTYNSIDFWWKSILEIYLSTMLIIKLNYIGSVGIIGKMGSSDILPEKKDPG